MNVPRIAVPEPTSFDAAYNDRCWPQYAQALQAVGAEPVSVPLDAAPAEVARLIASCQGVLLPGSPADVNPQKYGEARAGSNDPDPRREAVDELLLQDAFNLHKPLLGICYGFQSMNVWLGGTLLQDLPTSLPGSATNHSPGATVDEAHPVELATDSQLFGLAGSREVLVNSSHHQAVAALGDNLAAVATSPADGVIEAAEMRGEGFVLGVQWHPERTAGKNFLSARIFGAFAEAARAWKLARPAVGDPRG